ncbi:SCO family protein [Brevibacillus dissolubilis]|uniref:SCO family protein n=1 Tax=Brevibacillus dissolubilis TaxID=1844116 RepID=UPI001116C1F2|nr:SCO family protein [Brevibacillus dissolubilis]
MEQKQPQVSKMYWVIMSVLVLIIVAGTAFGYGKWWGQPDIPVIKAIDDFDMQEVTGQPYQFSQHNGKVRLVSFIFTRCPDVCPPTTQIMSEIQDELKNEGLFGTDVELVTISFDPENDTPEALKEYAAKFNADFSGWQYLTGTPDQIKEALARFGVGALKQENGLYIHTMKTFLVDKNQNLRKMYGMAGDMDTEEILADMKALAKE